MNEVSIKVRVKIAKKIYKLSEETNKNSSYHINRALENYIEEQGDLKTAVERLKDKKDIVISPRQLRKSLGL